MILHPPGFWSGYGPALTDVSSISCTYAELFTYLLRHCDARLSIFSHAVQHTIRRSPLVPSRGRIKLIRIAFTLPLLPLQIAVAFCAKVKNESGKCDRSRNLFLVTPYYKLGINDFLTFVRNLALCVKWALSPI